MSRPDYATYRGLPPVAGLSSMEDAMKRGLSVDECVRRVKRYHYALRRLHQIFTARITAEPIYELKMGFSYHSHLCAEHVSTFAARVAEMREPPLGLDVVPDPNLELFFDEILAAPTTEALLLGLYHAAIPALQAALARHMAESNPLADQPTVRLCKLARFELDEVNAFGEQALAQLVDENDRTRAAAWLDVLDQALAAAGGLDGTAQPSGQTVARMHSATPYRYDPEPKRDERFPDPYNMGVNAEVFLYDPEYPPEPKTLMMYYKRIREIDVPEMMASIIVETEGKPWDYYRDMTRQLWDEARHAMMGEVGFAALGVDWRKVMINFTWSMALNTQLKPIERHAVLYFIEQGLMPRTGKRHEWETAKAAGNPLAMLFQDYDWADEVLHAHIGRQWYVASMPSTQEAVKYGDRCWSKVLMDWNAWREQGLTKHHNWWPDVYREACARWGIEPDPKVLAYATTYESTRADLKDISASA